MLKKIGFLTVLVVGGLVLFNSSYASLGWKKAKGLFDSKISPELKVEMIRDQVAKLSKDMKKNISAVAAETVAVENLREEIAVAERNHKEQLDTILTMRKDLDTNQ